MRIIKYLCFGTAGALIILMIAATVLEKTGGTSPGSSSIYSSPLFIAAWGTAAVASAIYIFKRKLQKSPFSLLLHLAFLVILAGAFATYLNGRQGSIHLRVGDRPSASFAASHKEENFPFQIQLTDFYIDYYEGSAAPMDFTSRIRITDNGNAIEADISMNNIFSYRHYRFYQSSYDKDMKGSTLAVSYDPWGIAITYAGYLLLLVSICGFFFQRHSAFRRLLRHPVLRKASTAVCLLLCPSLTAFAAEQPKHLSKESASSINGIYLYHQDRICPLQTLAKDFTLKIYGKSNYKGLNGEQVLTGWFFFYDDWKTEPIIRIKSKAVQRMLGIKGQYACLNDFFGAEGYKLKDSGLEQNAKYKREINEANEKFNLISMVATGSMLRIFPCRENGKIRWFSPVDRLPDDLPADQWLFIRKSLGLLGEQVMRNDEASIREIAGKIRKYQQKTAGGTLPSDRQIEAEKLYNSLNYTKIPAFCCLVIGLFAFIHNCRKLVRNQTLKSKTEKRISMIQSALLGLLFVFLAILIGLRSYISGHIPVSNGFETMQAMAACASLISLLFRKRFEMSIAFGFIICGFSLLVSMLGESNPPITPLMPVLASPLLSIHVLTIMISYALLAFLMLNGTAALIIRYAGKTQNEAVERLYIINRILLYPAIFLLASGIFIGAVWANVSWGRYWGWDPKETWALITLMIYSAAFHTDSLPYFKRPMFFHWFCIIAFLSVLITYFGVNFFMAGLHSYA